MDKMLDKAVREYSDWFASDGELDSLASKITLEALNRLYASTFRELAKKSGSVEALNTLKLYAKATIYTDIPKARKMANLDGNGPDAILVLFQLLQASIVPSDELVGEIREKAAVDIVNKCPFSNESPDLCVFLSHYHSQAICDLVNPEYESVFTHHLSNGDPYCRMVIKRKSDPTSILDEPGKILATLPRIELPADVAFGYHIAGASAGINNITSAFIDLHGPEEAKKILSANAKRIGYDIGKEIIISRNNIKMNEKNISQLINSMGSLIRQQGECKEIAGDVIEKEISSCSFQTWTKEFCYQYEAFIQGMLEVISPDFEFSYDRMITKGDKICHWTIKKKGETAKNRVKEEAPSDDPIKRLTNKFIDGEITEEEYVKKMAVIKKHHPR